MPTLKFWNWFKRKTHHSQEPGEIKDEGKIIDPKNVIMITTETSAELVPVRVFDDHTLKWKRKKIKIKADRPAHILKIPNSLIVRNPIVRLLGGVSRYSRFNLYTAQQTAELTHDPHLDHLDEKMKMRFEQLLKLEGIFAKVDAGGHVMKGLPKKKGLADLAPYFAIVIIVFLFLFAYFK